MQQWYNWLFEVKKKDEEKRDGGGTSKDSEYIDRQVLKEEQVCCKRSRNTTVWDRISADSEGRTRCQAVNQM